MKFCPKCGNQLVDEAVICPACGCSQESAKPAVQDGKSFGFAVLGFFVPVAGLILYLLWKDTTPLKAKSAGKGALISTILYVIFIIAYIILIGVFAVSGVMDETYYDMGYETYLNMML